MYEFGLFQSQKFFSGMHETFGILAKNIDLGRDASEYIEDLKRFRYEGHTIFYMITSKVIFIIRVLS